jgi:hypothetical protein
MSPRWLQLFRPKSRWFQYRLRTLFVLMTLLCVWLSYNAWRYQQEKAIVAGIMARDPKAEVVWAGPSWLNWLDKDSVPPIFCRVNEIMFDASEIPADVSELQLQKLSSLKQLRFLDPTDDDKEMGQRIDAVKSSLPGTEVQRWFTSILTAWGDVDAAE